MLFIGPEAELRFGRRHFMELTTAFTAMPQFTVLNGRQEVGRTDPALLTARADGPGCCCSPVTAGALPGLTGNAADVSSNPPTAEAKPAGCSPATPGRPSL